MSVQIQKAERKQVKIRIALIGPSGSGKTFSALRLAKGMGGKTLLIDTENRRSEYYATNFDFDVIHLEPPFTPERYVECIKAGEDAGYDMIILDSASHEWMGRGGCLNIHSETCKAVKNSYTAWDKVTPRHDKFVEGIVYSKTHMIINLRGKDEYVLQDEKGKQVPKKVGVGAQMRDGLEYECTVSFLIDQASHQVTVSKDNTGLFSQDAYPVLTEEHGKALLLWATSGKAEAPRSAPTSEQAAQGVIESAADKWTNFRERAAAKGLGHLINDILNAFCTEKNKSLIELVEADFIDLLKLAKSKPAEFWAPKSAASVQQAPEVPVSEAAVANV